ncbi:hypothetical protein [Candidatus Puniceispirillum sp.]|uniref:hypothetical protein n=1 Tax=Candidatus Puniceispirillum sp. TaxID=2026719 RepID=UPI003F6A31E0
MNETSHGTVINAPSYGHYFDQWRSACPVPWQAYTHHDFVTGLAASQPAADYRDWIDTYASVEYQALCRDVGLLIDNAITTRLGTDAKATPRWHALCDRLRAATELEIDFWQMGMKG